MDDGAHDEMLRRMAGPKPSAGRWEWCESCLRWEMREDYPAPMRLHDRPPTAPRARLLYALQSFFGAIATFFGRRADIAQVRYLVATRQHQSEGRPRERERAALMN